MTSTRDLLMAVQSGKSAVIQATFDAVMTEKTTAAIEAYREAVIDNTFNTVSESTEEDLVEDADDQSIDELSKATLGSYMRKAEKSANDMGKQQHTHQRAGLKHVEIAKLSDNKRSAARHTSLASKEFGKEASLVTKMHKRDGNVTKAAKKYWDKPNNESTELQLEDYSLEEIQDFMESEDFASLDELSKKTLASYTKNAAISAVVGKEKADASTSAMNQRLSSGDARGAEYHASKANSANRKVGKRIVGIVKATDKLAKD